MESQRKRLKKKVSVGEVVWKRASTLPVTCDPFTPKVAKIPKLINLYNVKKKKKKQEKKLKEMNSTKRKYYHRGFI